MIKAFLSRLTGAIMKQPGLDTRRADPLGPWSHEFEQHVAREINPWLYEAIREACGPIDGAINKLVMLDGILRVEGTNGAIVQEIEDWMNNVLVNDLEVSLQAFYALQSNEMYEQGFAIGAPVIERDGVTRLRVADSKGVYFKRENSGELQAWYAPPRRRRSARRDGMENIERVLRNNYQHENVGALLDTHGYRQLDLSSIVYCVYNPEADNPYGTSLLRSTEYDARVLLVMKTAINNTWERFGDPIFNVLYKTKAKVSDAELERRRIGIAKSISNALAVKRGGNSADVINAVGPNDELDIKVLGHDGQVLEIEMPARHILENIVAKSGLPSWMLGFHWSTAERLAQRQGEIALQESRTRFARRRPALERIIATHLRARGRTWKKGDWYLVQELPSLQDLLAQSQAAFLDAQRALMLSGAEQGGQLTVTDDGDGKSLVTYTNHRTQQAACCKSSIPPSTTHKSVTGEYYVSDATTLMQLEQRAELALLSAWNTAEAATLAALGLSDDPTKSAPVFSFTVLMRQALEQVLAAIIQQASDAGGDFLGSVTEAWSRGIMEAAEQIGGDSISSGARADAANILQLAGMSQVKTTAFRVYRDDIVAELSDGAYDGANPRDVATALSRKFAGYEYDWLRLARSEIAAANSSGKMLQYIAHGVSEYNWVHAGGACQLCLGLSTGGPYKVGAGPLPMHDSHPNCRCTVTAVVPD